MKTIVLILGLVLTNFVWAEPRTPLQATLKPSVVDISAFVGAGTDPLFNAEKGKSMLPRILNSYNAESSSALGFPPDPGNATKVMIDPEFLIKNGSEKIGHLVFISDPNARCRPSGSIRLGALAASFKQRYNLHPAIQQLPKLQAMLDINLAKPEAELSIPNETKPVKKMLSYPSPLGTVYRIQYQFEVGTREAGSHFNPDWERWIYPLKNGQRAEAIFNAKGNRMSYGPATTDPKNPDLPYFPWSIDLAGDFARELTTSVLDPVKKEKVTKTFPSLAREQARVDEVKGDLEPLWFERLTANQELPVTIAQAALEMELPIANVTEYFQKGGKDSMPRDDFERDFCKIIRSIVPTLGGERNRLKRGH